MSSLQALVLPSQLPQVAAQAIILRAHVRVAFPDLIGFNAEDVAGLAENSNAHFFLHCMDGVRLRGNCDRFGAVLLCQHIICLGLGGGGLFCCTPPGLVVMPKSGGIIRNSTHAEAGANRV